jgi:hypothetical protein
VEEMIGERVKTFDEDNRVNVKVVRIFCLCNIALVEEIIDER